MPRWALRLWSAASLGLVIAAIVECVLALEDPRAAWWYLVSSDTLNIPAFYQNVFVDGYSWRAYSPSAATFLFPDALLYFSVRPFVGHTACAVVIWDALCYLLLTLSAVAAGRAVLGPDRRRFVAPGIACLAAAILGYCSLTFFMRPTTQFALPIYHTGALTCTFAAIVLIVRVVHSERRLTRISWCLGLAILCALATFSDRLFGVYFAAPAALAAITLRIATRSASVWSWSVTASWVAATAVGCLAGVLALKGLTGDQDPMNRYWTGIVVEGVLDRTGMLLEAVISQCKRGDVLVIAAIAWVPLSAATCLVEWRSEDPSRSALVFYCLFSLYMLAAVTAVFLLSGTSVELYVQQGKWDNYGRYFIGPMGAAYFGFAMLVADRLGGVARPAWKLGLVGLVTTPAIGLVVASAVEPKTKTRDVLDYYPQHVRAIDEACARAGVRHGMAGYWQAREVTLLSRTGLRVSPTAINEASRFGVVADLWLSNAEEIWKPPAVWTGDYDFEFLISTPHKTIERSLVSSEVIEYIGTPAERIRTEPFEVLIYTRPSDVVFRQFADLDLELQFNKYRLDPHEPRRFYAVAFRPAEGSRAVGLSVVAPEQFSGEAVVVHGPYLVPRQTGKHRVRFHGTAPADAVVDVVHVDHDSRQVHTVASTEFPPSTNGYVTLEFEITRPMLRGMLEFRMIRTRPGPLVYHWVEFEAVP